MEQNCGTSLSASKFNFLALDSLQILPASLTSSYLGEHLKFASIFAIFLWSIVFLTVNFSFLVCLLPFHSSKIVYLRRSYYCNIIYININWDKEDLKTSWINSTRNPLSFLVVTLNLKQAKRLHKNWKTCLPICNPAAVPALQINIYIYIYICYNTCSIHILKKSNYITT